MPPVETSPVMLRMQLAVALRELRKGTGLMHEDIAERTGRTKSSISRYELGQTVPKLPVLRDILRVLGVDEDHPAQVRGQTLTLEDLEAIANGATRRGWFASRYGDVSIPDWFATYGGLEPEASELRIFHQYIPGLFQTSDYAKAVLSDNASGDAEVNLAIRMARQEIFHRPNPPQFRVVLDEAALHRQVGGRMVLRRQIHRLVERASLPHVSIQILPFAAGVHSAKVASSFVILGFGERLHDVIYLEHFGPTGSLVEGDSSGEAFHAAFRTLADHALAPGESLAMLRRLAGSARGGDRR